MVLEKSGPTRPPRLVEQPHFYAHWFLRCPTSGALAAWHSSNLNAVAAAGTSDAATTATYMLGKGGKNCIRSAAFSCEH